MEKPTLTELAEVLRLAKEAQNNVQKELIAQKKAKADKSVVDATLANLANLKTASTEAAAKLTEHYPTEAPAIIKNNGVIQAAKTVGKQQKKEITFGSNFGPLPLNQSKERPNRTWARVGSLDASSDKQSVYFRARLHSARHASAKLAFLTLRQRLHTIQVVLDEGKGCSRDMIKFAKTLAPESIIIIAGTVAKTVERVEACTQQDVEIHVTELWLESKSLPKLPLGIEDASRKITLIRAQKKEMKEIANKIEKAKKRLEAAPAEEKAAISKEIDDLIEQKSHAQKYVWPNQKTRLDNRFLDLRTQTNQAIFKIQSGVCMLFREFLLKNNFTEIHSPKMLEGASEGGAEVFKIQYFDREQKACLAQSPQLYKQMAICADMERVFEVGPVFRAETAFTHRHLTEFIGLDLEMAINEHYHEVIDVLDGLFCYIFEGLETRFATELNTVQLQFPFEPIKYTNPSPRLLFSEGLAMLRAEVKRVEGEIVKVEEELKKATDEDETERLSETLAELQDIKVRALNGATEIGEYDDLSTPQEKLLGKLVKEKLGVDFYFLDKYPADVRPFYTMLDPTNPKFTNSYDLFIRSEEICSGSQRIHDPEILEERAKAKGVPVSSIQDYVNAFKFGAPPHGGGGVGMERVVMLYLGLPNIRKTSMFPRDPARLAP